MNAHARCVGECFADVSQSIDKKIAAIKCHESQLKNMDLESSRDLARAMGRISGYEYAEAFQVLRVRV
jgi:LmbE family N-acetylglucosaminyl deacetylase